MAIRDTISRGNSKGRKKRRRFYKRPGFWLVLFLLGLLVGGGGCWGFWVYSKPYREHAETYDLDRINDLEVPSVILDRNNKEIGRIFVQNRSVIPYAKIPKKLIDALIAGEDASFESNDGLDYFGIARALYHNTTGGEERQGASTITQQLARNAYDLKNEALRNHQGKYERKLIEAFLARRIKQKYKNEDILEFYLNRIYFGSGFHGVRSASLGYFGKEPEDLTTEECASLVGLIKNPTGLSPLNNPAGNKKTRDNVLTRMTMKPVYLDPAEATRLKALPVKLNPKPLQRGTSHLYERIADEIRDALGDDALAAGGYRIHTTILAEAQTAAQETLLKTLAAAESRPDYPNPKYADYRKASGKTAEYLQGAVLMVDHGTGAVLAHVGGRDYAQVPFDFIEMGRRPLGTAYFPFIYASGLENGLTPATAVADEPMDNRSVMVSGREGILGEWGMEVSSPVYEGQITARRALEESKIAGTVRFGQQAGLGRIIETAAKLGLPSKGVEPLPRLCVGWDSFSMKEAVRGIAAFGRSGSPGPAGLHYVESVEAAGGESIYRRPATFNESPPVIDPATAFQVHSMLAGGLARGSSQGALNGLIEQPFLGGGKGGTTADFQDTWFLGYNSRISCGVWTGFLQNGNRPIYQGAFSRDLAMPVWQAVMNAAAPSFGGEEIKPPSNVVQVPVCHVSGQRATQFCYEMVEDPATHKKHSRDASIDEYFRKGTENIPFCTVHSGTDGTSGLGANNVATLDAIPIRPKAPSLLGADPYHAEQPDTTPVSSDGGFVRRRTNVLDSLDLKDKEEQIRLSRPNKMQIEDN